MIGTLGEFVRQIRDKLSGTGDPIPVDIGDATVSLNGDVIVEFDNIEASLGAPVDGAASSDSGTSGLIGLVKRLLSKTPSLVDGRVPVFPAGVIDTGNGYDGVLASGQVFTGAGIEVSPRYGTVSVCVFSSHVSASLGLKFQASINNVNWETIEEYTYSNANKLESYSFAPSGRYFRLVYTNGGTATSKTAIFTVFRTGYTKSSSHRIGDNISAEKDAELVKAVLAAMKPNGDFTDIHCTAGGNLKVSIEEVEGSLPVSGTINTLTGLDIPAHDHVSFEYTDNNLTSLVYRTGGSGGTIVATLTLTYVGSRLSSIAKT